MTWWEIILLIIACLALSPFVIILSIHCVWRLVESCAYYVEWWIKKLDKYI